MNLHEPGSDRIAIAGGMEKETARIRKWQYRKRDFAQASTTYRVGAGAE